MDKLIKEDFEANMLDGDKVNDCGGATLSAESVLEYITETLAPKIRQSMLNSLPEEKETEQMKIDRAYPFSFVSWDYGSEDEKREDFKKQGHNELLRDIKQKWGK